MDEVLRDMTDRTSSYIDDIIIYSKTWEDHMNHIEEVLGRLERTELTVKRSKCEWGRKSWNFWVIVLEKARCASLKPEIET